MLLDRAAARSLAALQQHRAPHHRLVLLQDEEDELPAAAVDVDDLVVLVQVTGHGGLVLREACGRHERQERYGHPLCEPHCTPPRNIARKVIPTKSFVATNRPPATPMKAPANSARAKPKPA